MQPTPAPVANPIKPYDARRPRRRRTIRVEVDLDEIDTDDLVAELESRNVTGPALPGDECARIATLHLCGQRAQAEREALALVLEIYQGRGGL